MEFLVGWYEREFLPLGIAISKFDLICLGLSGSGSSASDADISYIRALLQSLGPRNVGNKDIPFFLFDCSASRRARYY